MRLLQSDALKHRGIVLSTTLMWVGLFGGSGFLADYLLGTRPMFLIIGVIASFPVVQIMLVRRLRAK